MCFRNANRHGATTNSSGGWTYNERTTRSSDLLLLFDVAGIISAVSSCGWYAHDDSHLCCSSSFMPAWLVNLQRVWLMCLGGVCSTKLLRLGFVVDKRRKSMPLRAMHKKVAQKETGMIPSQPADGCPVWSPPTFGIRSVAKSPMSTVAEPHRCTATRAWPIPWTARCPPQKVARPRLTAGWLTPTPPATAWCLEGGGALSTSLLPPQVQNRSSSRHHRWPVTRCLPQRPAGANRADSTQSAAFLLRCGELI